MVIERQGKQPQSQIVVLDTQKCKDKHIPFIIHPTKLCVKNNDVAIKVK